ncbi:MAG: zinc-ribbon domain containing protein [Dehalococcoidia bacterium]|nr:zinc-ribbon domain containing protein [Dehalococcoidia bacterium]
MSLEDKSFQCFDCSATYVFTAAEQEQFQSKGHTNAPKRCPACRQSRKQRQLDGGFSNNNSGLRSRPQMFPATCAHCGKTTEVPFEPRQGRPVYCRECYSSVRPGR